MENINSNQKNLNSYTNFRQKRPWASLAAQWLRVCLPMQGTWVWALVWEDPTCCGATKPVHHSYWACALEPARHNSWPRVPQLLKPTRLEPMLCSKRSHPMRSPRTATKSSPRSPQLEKAQQRRPNTAKNKEINSLKKRDLKTKIVSRDIIIYNDKRASLQENVTIVNMCPPNNRTLKYIPRWGRNQHNWREK